MLGQSLHIRGEERKVEQDKTETDQGRTQASGPKTRVCDTGNEKQVQRTRLQQGDRLQADNERQT
jgi:hypothetical protein